MAIDINIPSQVKNYANLAAFPATGTLKTIFIANDTNKTYRWTGSVYVEISGTDTSSLVPTSRTLTINGTTQDLSADRTFTISTGITIGTTAITSGTVGRVLFEGTGNVVQESANLFWDNTNGRLGIGGTPTSPLHIKGIDNNTLNIDNAGTRYTTATLSNNGTGKAQWTFDNTTNLVYFGPYSTNGGLVLRSNGTDRMTIFGSTGNIGINTTTDAGFKLDVNGTARFVGNVSLGSPNINDKLEVYGNILVRANDRIRLAGTTDGNTALWANSALSIQTNVKDSGGGASYDVTFGTIASNTRMLRVFATSQTSTTTIIGVNATLQASAVLQADSTTQGFLPPRMTTTQKNAIASPAEGLQVWDTTLKLMSVYNGTTWITL